MCQSHNSYEEWGGAGRLGAWGLEGAPGLGWSPTETDVQLVPGQVGVEGMTNSRVFSCPSQTCPLKSLALGLN